MPPSSAAGGPLDTVTLGVKCFGRPGGSGCQKPPRSFRILTDFMSAESICLFLPVQNSMIAYFPGRVLWVSLISSFPPLRRVTGLGSIFEVTTRRSARSEQAAMTAIFPPSW